MFVFTCFFQGIWSQLGWFLASKLGSNKYVAPRFFSNSVQVASKLRPRVVQEVPRASQESPKSAPRAPQECPKSAQECPKSAQECPKSVPRVSKTSPGPIFESSEVCFSWKDLNSNILELSPAPMFESSEVCSSREI